MTESRAKQLSKHHNRRNIYKGSIGHCDMPSEIEPNPKTAGALAISGQF